MLIAFHKPFGVISQFTPDDSKHRTLAGFDFPPAVYPIGRLDAESEGLLLLSDEASWNQRILDPRTGHEREYWVQVEGVPSLEALQRLAEGVIIQGGGLYLAKSTFINKRQRPGRATHRFDFAKRCLTAG